ncbi:acyl-homoserine-lactone synthase [Roseobacter litoralis]|uniref:Acyl-homoserine-lactone synthase n=1 Tax=Roseobacter litoralis (strain ATCC 49566 / DSM 6996 / JCM 21268 / NBRC 15278 / OCh 149) TaxID=391595 RepID=F7ZB16_ROSLO|nr:acyl-homoserine-lactone synthase [Roseobacter litoralis]AEI95558.1 autoinducer synthetase-like protein [Roseobacter litoralis Och 149]
MQRLISRRQNLSPRITDSIFMDRGRQFVDRLQWSLRVTQQGHEIDEYDDDQSEYLIVHRHGKHMGSCRVRPTTCSTMIADHFLDSFPGAAEFLRLQKGRLFELTRFCRAPDISVDESKVMLENISQLMDEFRDQHKLCGFVAVVFPHVARFMDKIGMRYLLISKSSISGEKAYLICITQATTPAKNQKPKAIGEPVDTPRVETERNLVAA